MAEPAPGRNPATPVSSAAQPAATSAAASSAPAASASGAASSASSAAASSSAAPASSSAPQSSASSAAPSSSAPPSSAEASSSSIVSSSSRSISVTIASAAASESASSSSGLSGGAIGGIVGGVVGGLVLIGLFWMWMRRRKDKKHRVPPPPPRDFSEMTFHGATRPRMGSNMMSQANRASSYSALVHPGRPSSQYPTTSRSPSYYATYPIATPSTLPDSPPMPASTNGDSPPLSSGINTPAMKPVLAPLDTGLSRDNSASSGEREFGVLPKHKSSIDRLRLEGSDRAPSPGNAYSEGDPSSRATSPHPSTYGIAYPRASLSPDTGARYPRPPSMASLSSHSQGRLRKPLGAPHAGRTVALEMPKPLGARPDSSGDFFWQTPKVQPQGFDVGFEGHQRRMSRAATELDFHSMPTYGHSRMPSAHSTTTTSNKPRTPTSNLSGSGPGAGERQPSHSRSMNSMRGGQR